METQHSSASTLNRPVHPTYTLTSLASPTVSRQSQQVKTKPDAHATQTTRDDNQTELTEETNAESKTLTLLPFDLDLLDMEVFLFLKETINFTLFYEDTLRTYELFDEEGTRVLFALEISPTDQSCLRRNWLPSLRGYRLTIVVLNENGTELLRITGSTTPKLRIFKRTLAKAEVHGASKQLLGYVQQLPDEARHVKVYSVHDASGVVHFYIRSTPDVGQFGTDMAEAEFHITPAAAVAGETALTLKADSDDNVDAVADGSIYKGRISLRWGRLLETIFPSTIHNFGIQFPVVCEPQLRVLCYLELFSLSIINSMKGRSLLWALKVGELWMNEVSKTKSSVEFGMS